jgi:hypothetical protein
MKSYAYALLLCVPAVVFVGENTFDASAASAAVMNHYATTQAYKAEGTVWEYESGGAHLMQKVQTFRLVFRRDLGLKFTAHVEYRNGDAADAVAWGPLDNVSMYIEIRRDGLLEYTQTQTGHYETRFNQIVSLTSTTAGDVLADAVIDGTFLKLAGSQSTAYGHSASGLSLIQGDRNGDYWQEFLMKTADASIASVRAAISDHHDWSTQIFLDKQDFDAKVSPQELRYTMPEGAAAFDPRVTVPREQRNTLLRSLAERGSRDAQLNIVLDGRAQEKASANPSQTPDSIRKFEEAEALGYRAAYAAHAEVLVPANRALLPPRFAALTDAELEVVRQGVLRRGAEHCDERSISLLGSDSHNLSPESGGVALTDQFKSCETNNIPASIITEQRILDANLTKSR